MSDNLSDSPAAVNEGIAPALAKNSSRRATRQIGGVQTPEPALTFEPTYYSMSNMKRTVSAREFLHNFASLEKQLPPGESVVVTRRGEPIGTFVKQEAKAKVAMPDFKKDASRNGFTAKDGDLLLARMLKDEEFS